MTKEFINEPSSSPNASRNTVPATTTEVRAGINSVERKKFFAAISLEFRKTASTSGTGISRRIVRIVYFVLFIIAFKNGVFHRSL
ncbi:hypothetical protein D3C78_1315580 [compost metagenome]